MAAGGNPNVVLRHLNTYSCHGNWMLVDQLQELRVTLFTYLVNWSTVQNSKCSFNLLRLVCSLFSLFPVCSVSNLSVFSLGVYDCVCDICSCLSDYRQWWIFVYG